MVSIFLTLQKEAEFLHFLSPASTLDDKNTQGCIRTPLAMAINAINVHQYKHSYLRYLYPCLFHFYTLRDSETTSGAQTEPRQREQTQSPETDST